MDRKTQNLDGVALILIILGIIILITGENIGWSLIAIGILKNFSENP